MDVFERNTLKEIIKHDEAMNFEVHPNFIFKMFSVKWKFIYFLRLTSFLYYKSNLYSGKNQVFRILEKISFRVYRIYAQKVNCEISPYAQFGKGIRFSHLNGIIIHRKVIVGENCSIRHQVTIGNKDSCNVNSVPIIGDNVSIGAGAKILGPCSIGDNVTIGANAVVITNVPESSIAVGVPARIKIKK